MSKFMGLGVLFAAAGVSAITLNQHNETKTGISKQAGPVSESRDHISYDFAISCDVLLQNDLERDDFSNLEKSNAMIDVRDFYRVKWISRMPVNHGASDKDINETAKVSKDECVTRYQTYKQDLNHG